MKYYRDSLREAVNEKQDANKRLPHYHDFTLPTRRLKIGGVEQRAGVHRQTLWRWYKAGLFPRPITWGRNDFGSKMKSLSGKTSAWHNALAKMGLSDEPPGYGTPRGGNPQGGILRSKATTENHSIPDR